MKRGTKLLNIAVSETLYYEFTVAAAIAGEKKTSIIVGLIEEWVKKNKNKDNYGKLESI